MLIPRIGWRWPFAAYGLVGIFFAGVFYVWFRNTPAEHSWVNEAERKLVLADQKKPPPPRLDDGLAFVLSPATWWICGQQFCRAAGQIFFATWFATYLQETRGVSIAASGVLNSLPIIGIIAGGFLGGALSDFILASTGNRKLARSGLASLSMLACSMFVFAAYFIDDPVLAVCTISLGTFCAALGGPCGYTVTIDMGGRYVAMLFATMNMVGNLGAAAFPLIVPPIIKYLDWDAVLALFGLLYLGAAGFWLLIRPDSTVIEQSLLRRTAK